MAVADGVHRWLRSVDPSRAYDDFMLEMNRRGVYVIVPLTPSRGWCTLSQCTSTHSSAAVFLPRPLTRSAPRCPADRDGSPPLGPATCYPSCLLNFGQHVVNLFSPHPNVLLFTVGNEIINSLPRWSAAPCVKAYARDIQRFQRQCSASDHSRVVPLLYAAADNAIAHFSAEENDRLKMDYLTCPVAGDEDGERAIDVMGVNLFRFCSDQCTFRSCESAMVVGAFAASPIPVLLTEYGCSSFTWHINHTARVGVNAFQETRLLYSPAMTGVFSGGCAYTYGVRGGEEFAFFEGGGRSARGEPGAVKSCGWPDDLCRVDAYEQRLAEVEQRETQRKKQRAQEEEDGDGADDGAIMEHDAVTVACPVVLGVDLTLPDTRQGAEGYEPVPCQAGVGRMASEEDREADSEQDRLERQQEAARRNRTASTTPAAAGDAAQPADAQPGMPGEAPGRGEQHEPVADAPAPEDGAGAPVGDAPTVKNDTRETAEPRKSGEVGGVESGDGDAQVSSSDSSHAFLSLLPALIVVALTCLHYLPL